MLRKSCVSRSG
uniref:Uncharacterized protein n=1 Tax=Anguilla anguilla TaxID=7936 RepID=A0A0E9VQJ5_ANGAN